MVNLLLEGDDLEALLLRAHREGGTNARIVRAEKVRRGGILGFFAKEGFEVAVEIPKDGDSAAAAAEDGRPAGQSAGQSAGAAMAATFPTMPQLTQSAAPAAIEAGDLLSLADRTSAAERAATLAITRQTAYESAVRTAVSNAEGSGNGNQPGHRDELPAGSSPAERLAARLSPRRVVRAVRQPVESGVESMPFEPVFAEPAPAEPAPPEQASADPVVGETVPVPFERLTPRTIATRSVETRLVEAVIAEPVIVEPTVVESRFIEPRLVESDFALAEVVEILATEMPSARSIRAEKKLRANEKKVPPVVQPTAFTITEFPHVQFPEDRPWPALAGFAMPATGPGPVPEGSGNHRSDKIDSASPPALLNEAGPRTDLSEVTEPFVVGNQPVAGADIEPAADSALWFDTPAAAPVAPMAPVITVAAPPSSGRVSQFRDAVVGRHKANVSAAKAEAIRLNPSLSEAEAEPADQPVAQLEPRLEPLPVAQPLPMSRPETLPETLPEALPVAQPIAQRVAEPELQPVAQLEPQPVAQMPQIDQELVLPVPSMALSMSGGLPANAAGTPSGEAPARPAPVTVGSLTANSTARATTVVPRSKSRRGGHRALPIPRPAVDAEPPGSAVHRVDSDQHPNPDAEPESVPNRQSGQHAAEWSRPDRSAEPAAEAGEGPTNSDSAWKLLRRWRPGLRKQTTEDDDAWMREVGMDTQNQTKDESIDAFERGWAAETTGAPKTVETTEVPETEDFGTWTTVVQADTVQTLFSDAATLGAVPAGTSLIEGFDQLAADRQALRGLGIPAAWTEHLHAGDRFGSIVAMLGQLPEPRIRDDAAVIAVVGPADVVELEAHRTALDLPASGRPRAVTLVPGAVGVDRRAAIARSKRIRPVVISVPIDGYDDPTGTRKILTSIKAEAVIVVVDASRPLEEITSWIQALEQVDAIALDGALDVDSPAAVLGLDVPVIRVDGIAVDRIGWAALLCAQLAALDASR